MPAQQLQAILEHLGTEIKRAQGAIEQHAVAAYQEHFSTPDRGEQKPKTIKVPLPKPDGSYETKEVPVAALLHHNSLQLEEVRIKMKVSFSHAETGGAIKVELGPLHKPEDQSNQLSAAGEIELYFKRGDPPEGVARLTTELNRHI